MTLIFVSSSPRTTALARATAGIGMAPETVFTVAITSADGTGTGA